MLQDIRQNTKGTAAKIVVGLIVISFAFFGIESILLGGGTLYVLSNILEHRFSI